MTIISFKSVYLYDPAMMRVQAVKIILMLQIVLQLFAPLVHAHTQGEPSLAGWHVPGLEKLTTLNDEPAFRSIEKIHTEQNISVDIGSGITQNKPDFHFDLPCCLAIIDFVFSYSPPERWLSDAEPPEIYPSFPLTSSDSRAPPQD
jgi:hypothetical protein